MSIDLEEFNRKIRFDEDYEKLPKGIFGKKARLLFFTQVEREKQTNAFIKYDTKVRGMDKYYDLGDRKLLLLLVFKCEDGEIFTTLRSAKWENYIYFRDREGELFEVVRS